MQYNDEPTVLRLFAEGWTIDEIATYLSRTLAYVRRVIRSGL